MNEETLLSDLAPRECGIVGRVDGSDDDLARLMAMGVCAGRTVELVQHGDPMIIKVYGTRVGVSARLAERITVETCSPGDCALGIEFPTPKEDT